MSEDIVCSRAIPMEGAFGTEWRIEHLWCYTNGKPRYTVCDSDGDHCQFDGRQVSRYMRESEESWKAYNAWAAETGQDPLKNFIVNRHIDRVANWVIYFRNWIGASLHGLAVKSGKHGGKMHEPKNFPAYLKEYLGLQCHGGAWCMDGIHKPSDMIGAGYVGSDYAKIRVEYKSARSPESIARDIRRITAKR